MHKFKMASTSGGSRHGGKRVNSGHREEYKKAWLRNYKRIYVEENIFKLWLKAKYDAGYDSDFATHLLSLEYRRR